jgi:hypothetical protein
LTSFVFFFPGGVPVRFDKDTTEPSRRLPQTAAGHCRRTDKHGLSAMSNTAVRNATLLASGLALLVLGSRPRDAPAHSGGDEMLQPVETNDGSFVDGPSVPIDAAHRRAVAHKGVWLHVVTADDGGVLVLRRSKRMVTCPGLLSIIGEHHKGREDDEGCAHRAMHEELPALERLPAHTVELVRLREKPRWFLYDYPDGSRRDRALIVEYVVVLRSMNRSVAAARLLRTPSSELGTSGGFEQEAEAGSQTFESLGHFHKTLERDPGHFCVRRRRTTVR